MKIPVHAETQLNTEGGGGVQLDTPLLQMGKGDFLCDGVS